MVCSYCFCGINFVYCSCRCLTKITNFLKFVATESLLELKALLPLAKTPRSTIDVKVPRLGLPNSDVVRLVQVPDSLCSIQELSVNSFLLKSNLNLTLGILVFCWP